MGQNGVARAILTPLALFASQGRALSQEELWANLWRFRGGKAAFIRALEQLLWKGKVVRQDGLFTLSGSEVLLARRMRQDQIRSILLRRAHLLGRLLALAPFVRAIVVQNSVALGTVHEASDIDLLVITAPGRLYTARAILWLFLSLLGLRVRRRDEENDHRFGKFSLGFFVTPRTLDLSPLRLRDDLYFPYWFANLVPVSDSACYLTFWQKNKRLLDNLPNTYLPPNLPKKVGPLGRLFQRLGEGIFVGRFGDWLERRLARWNISHVRSLPENNLPTSTTIARRDILKLHAKDRRQEIATKVRTLLAHRFALT